MREARIYHLNKAPAPGLTPRDARKQSFVQVIGGILGARRATTFGTLDEYLDQLLDSATERERANCGE